MAPTVVPPRKYHQNIIRDQTKHVFFSIIKYKNLLSFPYPQAIFKETMSIFGTIICHTSPHRILVEFFFTTCICNCTSLCTSILQLIQICSIRNRTLFKQLNSFLYLVIICSSTVIVWRLSSRYSDMFRVFVIYDIFTTSEN